MTLSASIPFLKICSLICDLVIALYTFSADGILSEERVYQVLSK